MEKLDQHPSSGLHHRQPGNKQGKTQSMNPGLTELEPQALEDNHHYLHFGLQA